MSADGGARVADVLRAQGVRWLFTLCGGHISPILVQAKQRGIRVVDVRDEANAVFAADAVARLTGVPGVAAVTAGPGVTNTLTALKNAELAQSPLVLLGGAAATMLDGRGSLQDIDQEAAVAGLVKHCRRVRTVRELAPAVAQAFELALSGTPGPVFVECPIDLLYPEEVVRDWYGKSAGGKGLVASATRLYIQRHLDKIFAKPDAGQPALDRPVEVAPREPLGPLVGRAASLLAAAERPVLLVGSQALCRPQQAPAVAEAVERLGVPTFLAGMARGLLGPGAPLQLRHARRRALKEADLVVLAGVPCDFRLDYGRSIGRQATVVEVNLSKRELLRNRVPALPVPADPGLFLRRLAERAAAPRPAWGAWFEALRARDAERNAEIAAMAREEAPPVNPLAACQAIDRVAGPDTVWVVDGGDFVATASYVVEQRGPLAWLDPGVFGTLGVGAGFALAAKLVRPESEVWLLYGDGAAGFSLIELDTFARHGLGIVAVIGNDGGWAQIARDQVALLGDEVGTVLARTAYHTVADGLGGRGFLVEGPDQLEPALRAAQQAAREGVPALVNVHVGRSDFRAGSISM
ncbi:MAG: thiamine pyrophosphate-binding protein [Planctomycetota bacterium]